MDPSCNLSLWDCFNSAALSMDFLNFSLVSVRFLKKVQIRFGMSLVQFA